MHDNENWVFGAMLNICGSVCINLGTNLMKLGLLRFQKRRRRVDLQDALLPSSSSAAPPNAVTVLSCCQDVWTWVPAKGYCRVRRALVSKTWFIGFWCFMLGNVLNFLSFGYAAQSLLASLGSVQFVTNVLFARLVLKETITRKTVLGTVVLIAGMCLVVSFSCHGNPAVQNSLPDLIALFYDPAYLVYLACLACMLAVSLAILHRREERKSVSKPVSPLETDKVEALAYAVVSASVGAHAVTFFKILSELMGIAANVTPDDHVTKSAIAHSPFTYLIALAAIFTSAFWMQRLNSALRLYSAVLIIPLFQVMWVSLSVIGGGIFFHEFDAQCFRGETAFMFILGLLVIFFGVYLLSAQEAAEEDGGGGGASDEGVNQPLMPLVSRTGSLMSSVDSSYYVQHPYQARRQDEERDAEMDDVEDDAHSELEHESDGEEEVPSYYFGVNIVPVFGVVERRVLNANRQSSFSPPFVRRRSSQGGGAGVGGPTPFTTPVMDDSLPSPPPPPPQ